MTGSKRIQIGQPDEENLDHAQWQDKTESFERAIGKAIGNDGIIEYANDVQYTVSRMIWCLQWQAACHADLECLDP